MPAWIRQSTATTIKIGPFSDAVDGSDETGLTPTVQLAKNGGAFAARSETAAITHDANGWYSVPLNATDTNTAGRLQLKSHSSGVVPVWEAYMVLPQQVYDSLVAGSDALQVHTTELTNNLITAAALNDGAITAAKVATGALDADALATDAVTEIVAAVWAAATRTLTGTVNVNLAQAVPEGQADGTLGRALAGAIVQAEGTWELVGPILTLKHPVTGTTFAVLTLNDADTPTSRTRT